ncbi:hypothetical protein Hanom_Chr11g01038351 [Helianthus anomalus]
MSSSLKCLPYIVNLYTLFLLFFYGIMEFNNPNFHQLAGNGPSFKTSHWRSQLLTFCKTLDPCWESMRGWSQLQTLDYWRSALTSLGRC